LQTIPGRIQCLFVVTQRGDNDVCCNFILNGSRAERVKRVEKVYIHGTAKAFRLRNSGRDEITTVVATTEFSSWHGDENRNEFHPDFPDGIQSVC